VSSRLALPDSAEALLARMPHAIWRASQALTHRAPALSSGDAGLDAALPDGGWPRAVLVELLLQQHGIGEMQLLGPALRAIARDKRVALVQPPHLLQTAAWTAWNLPPENLLWIKPASAADALWSAEQILKNGCCGALLLWQTQARPEALRRLHLAAQDSDLLCWLLRPLAAAIDPSPSPLRLGLRPTPQGMAIEFVKRRGARRDMPLLWTQPGKSGLPFSPAIDSHVSAYVPAHVPDNDALLDRPLSSAARARSLPPTLV